MKKLTDKIPEKESRFLKQVYLKAQLPIIYEFFLQYSLYALISAFLVSFLVSLFFMPGSMSFEGILFSVLFAFSVTLFSLFAVVAYIIRRIRSVERKISFELPVFIEYVITCLHSGLSIPEIFEILSSSSEMPQLSKEAKRVENFMKIYGDLRTSISKAVKHTPSRELKDILVLISNYSKEADRKGLISELEKVLSSYNFSERESWDREMFFSALYFSFSSAVFISHLYYLPSSGVSNPFVSLVLLIFMNFLFVIIQDLEAAK